MYESQLWRCRRLLAIDVEDDDDDGIFYSFCCLPTNPKNEKSFNAAFSLLSLCSNSNIYFYILIQKYYVYFTYLYTLFITFK